MPIWGREFPSRRASLLPVAGHFFGEVEVAEMKAVFRRRAGHSHQRLFGWWALRIALAVFHRLSQSFYSLHVLTQSCAKTVDYLVFVAEYVPSAKATITAVLKKSSPLAVSCPNAVASSSAVIGSKSPSKDTAVVHPQLDSQSFFARIRQSCRLPKQ